MRIGQPGRGPSIAGTRPVELLELVSPLRYDILVRARFLEFLGERIGRADRHLTAARADAAAREAVGQPYHTWFTTIALPRYRPRDAGDPRRQLAAFHQRVRSSADLLRSFGERGFDPRSPVSLRTAVAGAATATGKPVARPLYPGDGCHRLALLLASGHRWLEPAWYRVGREPLGAPIDNTGPLLGALGIDAAEYHWFLALGYAAGTPDRPLGRRSLLDHVAAHRPDRLAELERVLEIDEPALVREPAPSGRTVITIHPSSP